MPRAIIPELNTLSDSDTPLDRVTMYKNYLVDMVKYNPWCFLPLGVKRRWWHWKHEHPLTSFDDKEALRRAMTCKAKSVAVREAKRVLEESRSACDPPEDRIKTGF